MSNYSKDGDKSNSYQIAWEKEYQRLLKQFLKENKEFDGSAIAAWMRARGLSDPAHHNLWGSQITYYAGLGWMTPVDRGIPTGAAHIAQVRVWRSNLA